jgi:hypothetical protein
VYGTVPDHQFEVVVAVDGGRDGGVVVEELGGGHHAVLVGAVERVEEFSVGVEGGGWGWVGNDSKGGEGRGVGNDMVTLGQSISQADRQSDSQSVRQSVRINSQQTVR